ncbi:MAG: hypothetical protein ABS36_15230 [Acidobacteria bacterium SCN 69-37]|nr:MAG: hypothetical protein ABS36_15230 [Acidobacteria bacterium SCN 69-37]
MQSSLAHPYVVTVIPDKPAEAKVTTVSDLLIGSVSMAAALLVVALVLGAAFGGVRVALRRFRSSDPDRLPPVSPS